MGYRHRRLSILASACLFWLAGCTTESIGRLGVWAVDDCVRVMPNAGPPVDQTVFEASSGRVSIASAINEVVAFQLVLRSEGGVVNDVRVSVDDLVSDNGVISAAGAVSLYREHVIPISRYPAWFLKHHGRRALREYPDALIPLSAPRHGQPLAIPPGRNVPVWVDVRVPVGTTPGVYRSIIRVSTGIVEQQVPLELTVWQIALPDVPGLSVVAAVDHEKLFSAHLRFDGQPYAPLRLAPEEPQQIEGLALLTATFRLLHAHRLSPCLKRFYPVVKITGDDTVEVDWDDYDRAVADFLDGTAFDNRVPVSAWPLPLDRDVPAHANGAPGGGFSGKHAAHVTSYLRQCGDHFREKGWYDRHFVWYEPPDDQADEMGLIGIVVPSRVDRAFGRLVHAANTGARFLGVYPPQDMRSYGWHGLQHEDTAQYVTLFCPSARWYDPAEMRRQREAGRAVWIMPDEPPYSGSLAIEADIVQARALPWMADRLGAGGMLLCRVNDWSDGSAPGLDRAIERPDESSDAWLIYPGSFAGLAEPLPSIRLKLLRRGMQDHAYLELLRARGHQVIADRVSRALCKRAGTLVYGDHFHDVGESGWIDDPSAWSLARDLMAEVLSESRDPSDADAALSTRVNWTRFDNLTQGLRVQAEGVRLRVRPDGKVEAVVHVNIANDREELVSGTLRFENLPLGWSTPVGEWAVAALDPGATRRLTMTAEADTLPGNAHGVAELTIVLALQGSGETRVPARLAHITVQRFDTPPRIDGDLSDWPPGLGNVAGDFLLVGLESGTDATVGSPPRMRASQQTTAFICRDGQRLYLAMRCAESDPSDMAVSMSNHVRYDRTMPVGEDLVEVVIDPTNGATGSTGDLYHLIIKANGAMLAEQGIGWSPPTGPRQIWSADIKVATTPAHDGYWYVEASIPISAFDAPAAESHRQRIWGIDLARFEHRLGEYSSWSGAPRHLYSPRRLGNMAW